MPRFVVAVFPGPNTTGLKMSRDITVDADNIFFAKEMVENQYPGSKVFVRRQLPNEGSFQPSENSNGGAGVGFLVAAIVLGSIWIVVWVIKFIINLFRNKTEDSEDEISQEDLDNLIDQMREDGYSERDINEFVLDNYDIELTDSEDEISQDDLDDFVDQMREDGHSESDIDEFLLENYGIEPTDD